MLIDRNKEFVQTYILVSYCIHLRNKNPHMTFHQTLSFLEYNLLVLEIKI